MHVMFNNGNNNSNNSSSGRLQQAAPEYVCLWAAPAPIRLLLGSASPTAWTCAALGQLTAVRLSVSLRSRAKSERIRMSNNPGTSTGCRPTGRPAGWLTDGRQPFKFNASESSFGRNLLLYLCASLRCCAAGSESGRHHKLYLVNANLAPARRALSLCCASSSPYSTSSSSAAVAAAPSSHCLAQKLTLSCGDGEANHHHRLIRTLHKLSPAQQQPHHPQIVCRLCEENCRVLTGSSPGLGASLFH